MTRSRSLFLSFKTWAIEDNTESDGVVVTTFNSPLKPGGSIPGTGSGDIKIWLSTLGTVYPSSIGESR